MAAVVVMGIDFAVEFDVVVRAVVWRDDRPCLAPQAFGWGLDRHRPFADGHCQAGLAVCGLAVAGVGVAGNGALSKA
jgi:hypothetical protein